MGGDANHTFLQLGSQCDRGNLPWREAHAHQLLEGVDFCIELFLERFGLPEQPHILGRNLRCIGYSRMRLVRVESSSKA